MKNDFYVYAWLRPDGTPFYIGKGRGYRDKKPRRNRLFNNIVDKIISDGSSPIVVRIKDGLSEEEAFLFERNEIERYGRRNNGSGILANMTDGGEGTAGLIVSDETKGKLREAHLGVPLSPTHAAHISAALTGKRKSPDHVEKVAARRRGSRHSDESKIRMSLAKSGKIMSETTKSKISKALSGKPKSPDAIAKTAVALRGRPLSEETKLKLSKSLSGRAVSDEHKKNCIAGRRMNGPRSDNRSGFKGVSFSSGRQRWYAFISDAEAMGHKSLGSYDTAEEAAYAYDKAAVSAWGYGNCYLNFPDHYKSEAAE